MNKQLIIGGSIAVVLVVVIVLVFIMKKEHFMAESSGKIGSSGSGSPLTPSAYLTADSNGNIGVTANITTSNLDVEGNITLQGYAGNTGDILVSNGSSPPVWADSGNMYRYMTSANLMLPQSAINGQTLKTITLPINVPQNMYVIVDVSFTVNTSGSGFYNMSATGTLGDQSITKYGIYCGGSGYTNNFKFTFYGVTGNPNTFTLTGNAIDGNYKGAGVPDYIQVYYFYA